MNSKRKLRDGITDVTEELQAMVDIQLDTLAGDMDLLKSAWEGFILAVKESKQIAKLWKHEGISLTTLRVLVEKSKFGNNVDLDVKFKKNYNAMLDQLIKTCRQQSYMNSISYRDLKKNIKIMKQSFSEGLNK